MKLILYLAVSLNFRSISYATAANTRLLPKQRIFCNHETDLALKTVLHFFKGQHSLTCIDFSDNPIASLAVCLKGNNFLPFLLFDSWCKVSLGPKIDDSGLSAFSTTRGYLLKCQTADVLRLFPAISQANPRAKLLI